MARKGSRILDPEGFGLIFRQTAKETKGALLEMDAFYRPRGELPPAHFHPAQAEHFQVLRGTFHVQLENEDLEYHPGDTFSIPAGAAHAMHNTSDEKGHLLWQTRPALKSEGFFESVWSLEQKSPAGRRGFGQLLRLAVIFEEYDQEVRLANKVQRTALKILAIVAKLGGIKAKSLLPDEKTALPAD
jgi:quercetin dioxygenase-like cupin family protein